MRNWRDIVNAIYREVDRYLIDAGFDQSEISDISKINTVVEEPDFVEILVYLDHHEVSMQDCLILRDILTRMVKQFGEDLHFELINPGLLSVVLVY